MGLNYGSIHIERGTGNAMQFYGTWEIDYEFPSLIIEHFSGGTELGYDLGSIKMLIYIHDVYFTSTADAEDFINKIKTLQAAGTMTMELQVEAADYFEADGTNTSTEVSCRKISKLTRVSSGYPTTSHYRVEMMIFEEAG